MEQRQRAEATTGRQLRRFATGLLLSTIAIAGCRTPVPDTHNTSVTADPTSDPTPTIEPYQPLVAGCQVYTVYSQNRYQPYGTLVHDISTEADHIPKVISPKATDVGFAPNQVIPVDGWKSIGVPVYPGNVPSIRTNVWLHVARTKHDWVTFAGVRGEPTANDVATADHAANTSPDTGALAELKPECEIR